LSSAFENEVIDIREESHDKNDVEFNSREESDDKNDEFMHEEQ